MIRQQTDSLAIARQCLRQLPQSALGIAQIAIGRAVTVKDADGSADQIDSPLCLAIL